MFTATQLAQQCVHLFETFLQAFALNSHETLFTMASRTCEALLISSNSGVGPQLVKKHIPCPEPGPEEALVRVTYVAQNPTDGERSSPRSPCHLADPFSQHQQCSPLTVWHLRMALFSDVTLWAQ